MLTLKVCVIYVPSFFLWELLCLLDLFYALFFCCSCSAFAQFFGWIFCRMDFVHALLRPRMFTIASSLPQVGIVRDCSTCSVTTPALCSSACGVAVFLWFFSSLDRVLAKARSVFQQTDSRHFFPLPRVYSPCACSVLLPSPINSIRREPEPAHPQLPVGQGARNGHGEVRA